MSINSVGYTFNRLPFIKNHILIFINFTGYWFPMTSVDKNHLFIPPVKLFYCTCVCNTIKQLSRSRGV